MIKLNFSDFLNESLTYVWKVPLSVISRISQSILEFKKIWFGLNLDFVKFMNKASRCKMGQSIQEWTK